MLSDLGKTVHYRMKVRMCTVFLRHRIFIFVMGVENLSQTGIFRLSESVKLKQSMEMGSV